MNKAQQEINKTIHGDYASKRISKPTVLSYVTKIDKGARRAQPRLSKGSVVYLVAYRNGLYFTYCYTLKKSAEYIADKLEGTQQEIDFNSTNNPELCMHSVHEIS